MSYVHACPICSVVAPPNSGLKTFLCRVQIVRGQRSNRQMLMRPLLCKHILPFPESEDSATTLAENWNAWAARTAEVRANELKLTPEQRANYLYELGITGHPAIEQPK